MIVRFYEGTNTKQINIICQRFNISVKILSTENNIITKTKYSIHSHSSSSDFDLFIIII